MMNRMDMWKWMRTGKSPQAELEPDGHDPNWPPPEPRLLKAARTAGKALSTPEAKQAYLWAVIAAIGTLGVSLLVVILAKACRVLLQHWLGTTVIAGAFGAAATVHYREQEGIAEGENPL